MRKALRASILLLALSATAYAGEIPYGVTGGNQPAPPAAASSETEPTGESTDAQATQATIAEVALNLLQGVLSVI